jgi:hypothetical protein
MRGSGNVVRFQDRGRRDIRGSEDVVEERRRWVELKVHFPHPHRGWGRRLSGPGNNERGVESDSVFERYPIFVDLRFEAVAE